MQDYQVVYRTLTAGATVLSEGNMVAQNISEFRAYLTEQYLSQGYTIHSITLLRVVADGKSPYVTEWAYHLVKDLTVVSAKK